MCAANSEYTVLVPSEAWSGLLSGRGNTCPYPQPPAGLAKDHIRTAPTTQGVRYAVLAQVGTLEATPAFRLSAAGLHERLSSTVVVGGPCLRREPWRAVLDFLNYDFWFSADFFWMSLWGRLGLGGGRREEKRRRKVGEKEGGKRGEGENMGLLSACNTGLSCTLLFSSPCSTPSSNLVRDLEYVAAHSRMLRGCGGGQSPG